MLRKISQAQKDKHCIISHTWNLKKQDSLEAESRMGVARGAARKWGRRERKKVIEKYWSQGIKCMLGGVSVF